MENTVYTGISGLKLLLDHKAGLYTDAGITPLDTTTTQPVAMWKDQSGQNNHAIQTTAANQPTSIPGLAGDNALIFSGNQCLTLTNTLSYGSISVFVVARKGSTNNNEVFLSAYGSAGGYGWAAGSYSDTNFKLFTGFADGSYGEDDSGAGVWADRPATTLWGFRNDGTNLTKYADGVVASTTPKQNLLGYAGSIATGIGALLIGGNFSQYFFGTIDKILVYSPALSDADTATVNASLQAEINAVSESPLLNIACVGNSITYGWDGREQIEYTYPEQLAGWVGANGHVGNFGYGGRTMDYIAGYVEAPSGPAPSIIRDGTTGQTTTINAFLKNPASNLNCLVLMEVINSLNSSDPRFNVPGYNTGQTDNDIYLRLKQYALDAKAAGWQKVYICTATMAVNLAATSTDYVARHLNINQLLRNDHSWADGLIDVAAITQGGVQVFNSQAACANATYYTEDQTHLTPLGYQLVAQTIYSALASLTVPQEAGPVFSPVTGASITQGGTFSLSDSDSQAAIYYTLDGSTPTTSSALYTQPVALPTVGSVTVKALAHRPGNTDSDVATATYTVIAPSVSCPTAAQIAEAVAVRLLLNPANKIATDNQGNVRLVIAPPTADQVATAVLDAADGAGAGFTIRDAIKRALANAIGDRAVAGDVETIHNPDGSVSVAFNLTPTGGPYTTKTRQP